ncbi:MAG: hypothetical protein ABI537_01890 [Casimicrobiaceae bacterium]
MSTFATTLVRVSIAACCLVTPATLAQSASADRIAPGIIGFVDTPSAEATTATTLRTTGWALDPAGIAGVEVQLDEQPTPARYGIARPDVAQARPGYPQSANAGFVLEHDFAPLTPIRHGYRVVARNLAGETKLLAKKSLLPPAAFELWTDTLPRPPQPMPRPFHLLMATSGILKGGAVEIDTQYRAYESRTQRIGMAVPILYLRTTLGRAADWVFDPNFDVNRNCGERALADDALRPVIEYAIRKRLPVQFILNGGIWADAACNDPEWDVNDHLEDDPANCQWAQDNRVYPDDYLKNLAGSQTSPEIARSLTYNVYATEVRRYKKRNLQAAARIVAEFARTHPELFIGVALDADTYMNPFFEQRAFFDFNPGMLRQFRAWLRGSGPYAGKPEAGAPDLSKYRRKHPLSLAEVNRLSGKRWRAWTEVDPPRQFPGTAFQPAIAGRPVIWDDPWYQEWDAFRKHVVALHYDELSIWTHEAGIASDRIFSAQAFVSPDKGVKPFALRLNSRGQNHDSAGVSVEGAIPRAGHLGAILYGEAAENRGRMEGSHSLFAAFGRMDPGWAIVESNATDLKHKAELPVYAASYRTFRDAFNFDGSSITLMAWNGSNGIYAGQAGYLPYTSWRNTPGEEALRDFMVSHANLVAGARLWTFGSSSYADNDGWTADGAAIGAGRGALVVTPATRNVTLHSPPDQILRRRQLGALVLGVRTDDRVDAIAVFARASPASSWQQLARVAAGSTLAHVPGGLKVPLEWPSAWRTDVIAEQIKIVLTVRAVGTPITLDRIALVPRVAR